MNIKLFTTTLGVGALLISSLALANTGPGDSQALIMEQQRPLVRVKHHKPELKTHVIHHHKGHKTPAHKITTVKHKSPIVTTVKHKSPTHTKTVTKVKHKGTPVSY